MVCLYTGFGDVILELKKKPDPKLLHDTCTGLDGRDDKLLQWIMTRASPACSPTTTPWSSSRQPHEQAQPHASLPLHQHCLFKNGIHLGELFYFSSSRAGCASTSATASCSPPRRCACPARSARRRRGRHGMNKVAIVTGGTSGIGAATAT